jgi:GR25 family glycosyltransferase involved in LPS biosynthesis
MTTKSFTFDKKNTFCISPKSHTERWTSMERRFYEMNLEVTRFEADTIVTNKYNYASYLNDGQKKCSQAHITLWYHILENNIPYAMIIEDDAVFDNQWREKLDQLDINKIDCWDAVFLNSSEPVDNTFTWEKSKNQYLTGSYILSRQGIFALLELFDKEFHASDYMTVELQKRSNSYTYFPWIVIQEGKDSTIGSNTDADHHKVKYCLNLINYGLDNYIF